MYNIDVKYKANSNTLIIDKLNEGMVKAELDEDGMVVDFTEVKRLVHGVLDHQDLNAILPFNPTAENIARWICDRVPHCYKVDVQESTGNVATYERDE